MSNPDRDFPTSKRPFTPEADSAATPGFDGPVTVAATGPRVLSAPSLAYDHLESWPPLSGEQMAELYEALADFHRTMAAARTLREDEQMALAWEAATSLDGLLASLGIDTLVKAKRWSGDQLQQATAGVQEFEPLASVRLTDPQGREADLSLMRPGDILTAHLRAFGVVPEPEPVRKNCWTCKHSKGERGGWHCSTSEMAVVDWLSNPANSLGIREDGQLMPERTTDGCPGWEQKP